MPHMPRKSLLAAGSLRLGEKPSPSGAAGSNQLPYRIMTTRFLGFGLQFPCRFPVAEGLRPALLNGLPGARERERVGRHVLGDDAARADIGALADRDRRDQGGVRADEGAGADLGAVLVEAVVVAGDGAGADVGAGADARVAEIGEVVGLGARADLGVLDLDEVADPRLLAELRARPQPRERADAGAGGDGARLRDGRRRGSRRRSRSLTPGPKTTLRLDRRRRGPISVS